MRRRVLRRARALTFIATFLLLGLVGLGAAAYFVEVPALGFISTTTALAVLAVAAGGALLAQTVTAYVAASALRLGSEQVDAATEASVAELESEMGHVRSRNQMVRKEVRDVATRLYMLEGRLDAHITAPEAPSSHPVGFDVASPRVATRAFHARGSRPSQSGGSHGTDGAHRGDGPVGEKPMETAEGEPIPRPLERRTQGQQTERAVDRPARPRRETGQSQVAPRTDQGRGLSSRGSVAVEQIEGIDRRTGRRLREAGIRNAEQLALADAHKLAEQVNAGPREVLDWQALAQLLMLEDIDTHEADLLEQAGIRSVHDLAQVDADRLCREMADLEERDPLHHHIEPATVKAWVEAAKRLDPDD